MDRLELKINEKLVLIKMVNGQSNLHLITVDHAFAGYYDANGKHTGYSEVLTDVEIATIEAAIRAATVK